MNRKKQQLGLLAAIILGSSSSMLPPIALTYGIAQFQFLHTGAHAEVLADFTFAQGIIALLLILISPVIGWTVDKFFTPRGKRHYWLIIGSMLGFVACHLFAAAESATQTLFGWGGVVFSYAVVSNTFKALIPERVPADKLNVLSGVFGTFTPLCLSVCLVLILGLYADTTISVKMQMMAWLQLVLTLVAYFVIRRQRSLFAVTSTVNKKGFTQSSYAQFMLVTASKTLISAVIAATSVLPLFYLARLGLTEQGVYRLNAIMSLGVLLIFATAAASVYLSQRFQRQIPFLLLGAVLLGAALLGYAKSETLTGVIISSVIFQLGLGPVNAIGIAVLNRSLPNPSRFSKDIAITDAASHLGASPVHFATPAIVVLGQSLLGGDGYNLFFYFLFVLVLFYMLVVLAIKDIHEVLPEQSKVVTTGAQNKVN